MLRSLAALSICAATLTACGLHSALKTAPAPPTNSRVERCVDRLVAGTVATAPNDEQQARSYVRETYCSRFELRGWIYDDGALKLAAHLWLQNGSTCAEGVAGQPPKVAPCKLARSGGVLTIDCALLRIVRRSEVVSYIRRLQAGGPVVCEQKLPLSSLGVQ